MKKALSLVYRILLGVFAGLFALLALAVGFLAFAEAYVEGSARVLPPYEKADITQTLEKENWTEEDYNLLYHQTGLGRAALDALKGQTNYLLSFQEALFYDGEMEHTFPTFSTPHDMMKNYSAPIAPLEDGDVLVTSTCHTFGWRNGHAALVVSGKYGQILELVAPGTKSTISNTSWFAASANFMVLRLKDKSAEERKEIADWANDHLLNIDYDILTGFFSSPKDQGDDPKTSNCCHLVWQAYKHFGYDIDPDGGIVCSTRDIANSPYFEIVQVYGFDPDKLW